MLKEQLERLFINPENSIKDAMKVIDEGMKGIALTVDNNGRLIGILTDADVRKAILKGISLEEAAQKVMNDNYVFVTRDYSKTLVQTIFEQKSINQLPVIDDNMRVVDVIFYHDFYNKSSKENWVVIMAGGLGTRLAPLTKDVPKPMLRVGAKPILETVIEQLKSYGYKNIVLSLNYKAEIIENYFQDGSNFGVNIKYIKEKKRLGTAGAIRLAKEYLNKPFFVINGDILTKLNFEQLMQYHIKHENLITIGTKKYELQIPYGVVSIEGERVTRLVEKPVNGYFINGGVYCLKPEAIKHIPNNEFFDITQLIELSLTSDYKVGSFPITEYWMDIGQIDDYNQANSDYNELFRSENYAVGE